MSEEERLRENAERQLANQRIEELNAYMVRLMANVDRTRSKLLRGTCVYLAAWVTTMFLVYAFPVFIVALLYNVHLVIEGAKAVAEARGAVEVLKILGMVPPPGGAGRRRRRFWEAGIEMVKGWFREKQEAREEVYQPA